ncbi:MAG: biotin/lipoyl-binding protein [Gemmatimonadetes bacterium]|nr:biotin/lipoyl-binding protein [Gemmatimonadota bacterium]
MTPGWPQLPRAGRATLTLAALLLGPLACKGKAADAETAAGEAPAEGEAAGSSTMTLPVAGAPVRRGDLVLSVTTTGQVRSDAVADLRAETNGTVDEVRVRPGQAVKKGDVLVKLDQRPFDLAVREAEAALAEARIKYRGNLASDSILLGPGQEEERRQNALTSPACRARRCGSSAPSSSGSAR